MNNEPTLEPPVTIGTKASVIGKAEVSIASDPQTVWRILTDINRWPNWNKTVQSAVLEGPLAPGSVFRWKSGSKIVSKINRVEHNQLIAWTGKTMGITAFHVFRIQFKDGKTLVETEESFDGLIVKIFKGSMQKMLDKTLRSVLDYLKVEAERPH